MSRYNIFDRSRIRLRPVSERGHDLHVANVLPLQRPSDSFTNANLLNTIESIQQAKERGASVILMMGAHPIKLGLSRFIIDLMERGFISLVATNGAGIIHDYELATLGGTSENVAKWIAQGQFGLWQETSRLNEIVAEAASGDEGVGEAVGRALIEIAAPHADVSICAAGWRLGIPVTSHVTIGGDIIHAMPNMDGAAFGAASDTDFLIFTNAIENLERGVFLNVGTAVTGPEIFLKALSMSRNLAHQQNQHISDFTTAVFDLVSLPENYSDGPPGKEHSLYYYRPWKTLLCRTVAETGKSYYVQGDHRETIPALWK